MRLAHLSITLLALAAIVAPASASTYTWTGADIASPTLWADAGNWTLTTGAGNTYSYPNAASDIAVIGTIAAPVSETSLTLGAPITVGEILSVGSGFGIINDGVVDGSGNPVDVLNWNNGGNPALLSINPQGGSVCIYSVPMNLTSNLRLSGPYWALIPTGTITGAGGLWVTAAGTNGVTFRGTGAYTGNTVIESGQVLALGQPGPAGSIPNSNFYVQGLLALNANADGTPNLTPPLWTNNDRIGDSATVSMSGGQFEVVGVTGAGVGNATSEKIGTLEFRNRVSTVQVTTVNSAQGDTVTLTADNLVRKNDAIGWIENYADASAYRATNMGNTLGACNNIVINNKPTQYLIGGNGGAGYNKPVIPWMLSTIPLAITGGGTVNNYTFVTYDDATKSLRALDFTADYYQATAANDINTVPSADANVRIVGTNGVHTSYATADSQTVNNNLTINSLVVQGTDTADSTTAIYYNLNIAGGATLTVTSGSITGGRLEGNGTTGTSLNIQGGGTLNFGTAQAVINSPNPGPVEIDCDITGSGGLVADAGNTRLFGVVKHYTGDTVVMNNPNSTLWTRGEVPTTSRIVIMGESQGAYGTAVRGFFLVDTDGTGNNQYLQKVASVTGGGGLWMNSHAGKMIIGSGSTLTANDLVNGDIVLDGGSLTPGDVDLTNPRWNTQPCDLSSPAQYRGHLRLIDGDLDIYLGGPTENSGFQMMSNSGINSPDKAAIDISSATATMKVTVLPTYKPAIGDQWTIMDCTTATGNTAAKINGNYVAPVPAHLNGGTFVPTVNGTISSDDRYYFATTLNAADTQMYLSVIGMAKEGDATKDGRIGADDLALVGLNWDPSGKTHTWVQGDFDGDGAIGPSDLADVGLNWAPAGYVTSSDSGVVQPTPEPVTMALLAIGGLGLLARRNRR